MLEIFERAEADERSPAIVADQIVEEKLYD